MRAIPRHLGAVLALVVAVGHAAAAMSEPNPQLALSVAQRLGAYDIRVAPEDLTTAQAAALHLLLLSSAPWLDTQRRAKAILRNPDYAD